MVDSSEIVKHFELALTQYFTIDKNKHEQFSDIVQGLFFYKLGNLSYIMPFQFSDKQTKDEVINLLKDTKVDNFGFSLVQHYIHYGH